MKNRTQYPCISKLTQNALKVFVPTAINARYTSPSVKMTTFVTLKQCTRVHEQNRWDETKIKKYFWRIKVKVKGKVDPMLNQAPLHEDILGDWRYSSTHS